MISPREVDPAGTGGHVEDTLTILRRLPVFKNISLDLVKLYAHLSEVKQYAGGDVILRQGTTSDGMRLIVQGQVCITYKVNEREIVLQNLSADSMYYFGELALISNFKWFFTAYAASDVSILFISREAFAKVIERYPETFIETVSEIVKLRVKRFENQTDYLIDHLEEDVLNRLSKNIFSGENND